MKKKKKKNSIRKYHSGDLNMSHSIFQSPNNKIYMDHIVVPIPVPGPSPPLPQHASSSSSHWNITYRESARSEIEWSRSWGNASFKVRAIGNDFAANRKSIICEPIKVSIIALLKRECYISAGPGSGRGAMAKKNMGFVLLTTNRNHFRMNAWKM